MLTNMTDDQLKPSLLSTCQHFKSPASDDAIVNDLRSDGGGDWPESKEQEWEDEAERDDVDGEAVTTKRPAAWWQRWTANSCYIVSVCSDWWVGEAEWVRKDSRRKMRQLRMISVSHEGISLQMLDGDLPNGHCIAEQKTNNTKGVDGIEGNTRSDVD